ncbi:MAG: hypothetical protein H6R14_765 [Proteobacteria bacterium]|nr:hypothetical protein [Pseudomonadota bacterium]
MAYHITINVDGHSITGLYDDAESAVPPGAVTIYPADAATLLNSPGFSGYIYQDGAVSTQVSTAVPDVIFPPPWRD